MRPIQRALFDPRPWIWTAGIALPATVVITLQSSMVNFSETLPRIVGLAPWYVLFAWIFLLPILVLEAIEPPGGVPSMRRYLAGAVAAGLACVLIAGLARDHIPRGAGRIVAGKAAKPPPARLADALALNHAVLRVGLDGALNGILASLVYARLRRSRFAERALADAKLAGLRARHGLLAARLDAGRTALDPRRLLAELDAIEEAYDRDACKAEELMDALIRELRDAIPRLRADPVEATNERTSAVG